VTDQALVQLSEKLKPVVSFLTGKGTVEVSIIGATCLIRIETISAITPNFIVGLIRLESTAGVNSFVVDDGLEGGCLEISGGGISIVREFPEYRALFKKIYSILDLGTSYLFNQLVTGGRIAGGALASGGLGGGGLNSGDDTFS
jgi:hypothetical protein